VTSRIIVDAGALVGALSHRDQNFAQAGHHFMALPKPLYTCEPVITEASFLVRREAGGRQKVLDLILGGVLKIDFSLADEVYAVNLLMTKYDSIPMSLADACLVRMSELARDSSIFTFDGDFRIYRRHGRERIPLIGLDMS
jgi:uncharacterized protein